MQEIAGKQNYGLYSLHHSAIQQLFMLSGVKFADFNNFKYCTLQTLQNAFISFLTIDINWCSFYLVSTWNPWKKNDHRFYFLCDFTLSILTRQAETLHQQGTLPTYTNKHDNIPSGFEAEFLQAKQQRKYVSTVSKWFI